MSMLNTALQHWNKRQQNRKQKQQRHASPQLFLLLPFMMAVLTVFKFARLFEQLLLATELSETVIPKPSDLQVEVVPISSYDAQYVAAVVQHQLRLQNFSRPSSRRGEEPEQNCAFLLYGLPRSFRNLVLPSLVRNVLIPNAAYHCHVFVCFHALSHEPSGRSGRGGLVDTNEIYLLQRAVELVQEKYQEYLQQNNLSSVIDNTHSSVVRYTNFTDVDLWRHRGDLLNKTRYAKDELGQLLYFPWEPGNFVFPDTSDNIIRMWHAMDAAWQLMTTTAVASSSRATTTVINYTRIAMLRNDVFYITPIDVWQTAGKDYDHHNRVAVVPSFAKFPVNDRLMYGPYHAVEIWAAKRFALIEQHVAKMKGTGLGIHSERFLNYTIFPAIRARGLTIVEAPVADLCFVRTRVDGSLWINDCHLHDLPIRSWCTNIVQETIQRTCRVGKLTGKAVHVGVWELRCEFEQSNVTML